MHVMVPHCQDIMPSIKFEESNMQLPNSLAALVSKINRITYIKRSYEQIFQFLKEMDNQKPNGGSYP